MEVDPKTSTSTGPATTTQGDQHRESQSGGLVCCSRPHGNYVFFPCLLTTVAFILGSSAHHRCNFVRRTVTLFSEDDNEDVIASAFSIGLWSFMDPNINNVCFLYPSSIEFDSFFHTARAMAPLASVIGGIVMVAFWFSSCVGMSKLCWMLCSFWLMLASLFEGLTLLVFRSNFCETNENVSYDCKLATGSRMIISATVFYFLAAVSVCNNPAPVGAPSYYMTTVRTETTRPDGTKVVETRTVPQFYE